MATYKTPGVYIEEVSNFPPSVVPVETAIPAFIGYTEKAMKQNGENLHMVPTKIRSLGEFEQWYGAAPPMTANVYLDSDDQVSLVAPVAQFYTFDSLRMFFDNGGGDCYIISIGKYQTAGIIKSPSKQDFLNGLSELEKVDEPTIILFPDASLINKNTPNAIDLYDVQKAALSQCNKLQDRVLVCDLKNDAGGSISELEGKVQEFRDNIGINFLKYGAAYTPWLRTSLPKIVGYRDLKDTLFRGTTSSASSLSLKDLTEDTQIESVIDSMDAAVNLVDSLNTSTNSLKATSESLRGRFKILLEGFSKDLDIFNQSLRDTTTPHPFPGFFEAAIPATNSLRLLYQLLENLLLEASKALAVSGTAALNLEEIFQTQKLKTQLSRLKTHHERIKTLSAAQTSPDFGLGLELFPNDTSSNFLAAIGVIDPAYTSLADIPEDAATRSEYDDLYNSTIDVANNISIYGSLVAAAMRQANTASSAAAARIAGKESMDKITKSDIESSLRALIATQTSTDLTPVLRNEASGSLNTILADSTATNEDVGLAAIVHAISAQLAIAQPTLELGDSSTSPVIEQVEPYINQAIEFSRILALRVENTVAGNKAYTILDISWTLTETWVSMAKDAIQASYADFIDAFGSLIEAGKSAEELYEATLENSFGKYKSLKQKIASESSILPPSGAIAGVYANVDSNRGVFKAPANISLNTVIAPSTLINRDIQEDLNVDANAGKSVNAIRAFAGKGTLVWGARTLAGNDNEWRYVNVRRYFNFAEESIKKATEAFVFEPNDANTWAKIKGMITNFLTNQWRDGALQGAKPPQAFFVKVGLGETMTAQDVLEGRMIVEIGLAVVRPAEFIILRFSHKMPEA